MKPKFKANILLARVITIGAAALTTQTARAESATWNASPTNNKWLSAADETNWSTGAATFPGNNTGSLTNTDQATFSTNSSISTILIDGTEEAGTPLNIGSIAFLDNNLATNYVIGDALGNPLVMTSNADEGSSARQIFISGALRSAAVAPITATIAAPVILAPQSPTGAGFHIFQNNSTSLANGDRIVFSGPVSGGETTQAITLSLRGANTNNNTISGNISDGAAALGLGVSKIDGGTWTLSGNNTYTGVTSVSSGILNITGTSSGNGNFNLPGPGTLNFNASGLIQAGSIQYNSFGTNVHLNSGVVQTGSVTTNGNSDFRSFNMNGGELVISGNIFSPAGAVAVVFNGGTLKSNNASGITVYDANNFVQVNAAGAVIDTTVGNVTVAANNISGNLPRFDGNSSGAITIKGGNTLVSGIINNGVLNLQDDSVWDTNDIVSSVGGISGTDGTVTNSGDFTGLTINFANTAGPFTFAGVISGGDAMSLTKAGTGEQILTGENTYEGNTNINGGVLTLGSPGAIGEETPINFGGGSLRHTAANTTDYSERIANGFSTGPVDIDTNGQNITFFTPLGFNQLGGFTKRGAGTLTFTSENYYSGSTSILEGSLIVNNDEALSFGPVIIGGGSLSINGGITLPNDNFQISGVANTPNSEFGRIVNSSGDNTIERDIIFSATGGLTTTILSASGSLSIEGGLTTTLATGPRTFHFAGAGDITVHGDIVDGLTPTAVGVSKAGPGRLTLNGDNTYSGETTVSGGVLAVNGQAIPDSGSLIIDGGVVEVTGNEVVGTLFIGEEALEAGTYGAIGTLGVDFNIPEIQGPGIITVSSQATAGYSEWAAANAGGQLADDDFDNDGVPNGVEYFMGETGSSFTANPPLENGSVTWPKSPDFVGSYKVETSPDLVEWDDVTSQVVDTGTSVTYTPPTGEDKLFLRLVVITD